MSVGTPIRHQDFMADGSDSSAANKALNGSNHAIAFDNNGNVYVCNTSGVVHQFDRNGNFLGAVGSGFNSFVPNYLRVMYHPNGSVWLIGVDSPVSGENVQALCISGGPGVGTHTNTLGTAYGGIFSGGNNCQFNVDVNGNIWFWNRDNGGTFANLPRLIQVQFTGPSTLGIVATTDFSLSGWTNAFGILFNPVTGHLLLGGAGPASITVAEIDPANPSVILNSSTALNSSLPFQIGSDGFYAVKNNLTSLGFVNGNTLTQIWNHDNSTFGFTASINFVEYGAGVCWTLVTGGQVLALDVNAITILATLNDPSNPNSDHTIVSSAGLRVSPGGDLAVTTFANSSFGFFGLWTGVVPQLQVTPSSLSSTPNPFTYILPNTNGSDGQVHSQQLIVSNIGGGSSLPFTVSSDVPWLVPSPLSGDAGASPVVVTVKLNLGSSLPAGIVGLKSGTYTGHITVSTQLAGGAVIPVTLVLSKWGIP